MDVSVVVENGRLIQTECVTLFTKQCLLCVFNCASSEKDGESEGRRKNGRAPDGSEALLRTRRIFFVFPSEVLISLENI